MTTYVRNGETFLIVDAETWTDNIVVLSGGLLDIHTNGDDITITGNLRVELGGTAGSVGKSSGSVTLSGTSSGGGDFLGVFATHAPTSSTYIKSQAQIKIYNKGTAGVITFEEGSDNRIVDYSLTFEENHALELNVQLSNPNLDPDQNILSSSCALWSGGVTDNLEEGDEIEFGIYESDGITVTRKFYGTIHQILNAGSRNITLKCFDKLKRLDRTRYDTIIFDRYRDRLGLNQNLVNGYYRAICGDADRSMQRVLYANGEIERNLTNSGWVLNSPYMDNTSEQVAQPFIAESEGLTRISINYSVSSFIVGPYTKPISRFKVEIHADVDDEPSGTPIFTTYVSPAIIESDVRINIDTRTGSIPLALAKDYKYWVVIYPEDDSIIGWLQIKTCYKPDDYVCDYYKYTTDGSTWNTGSGDAVLDFDFYFGTYVEKTADQYIDDQTNNYLYILGEKDKPDGISTYFNASYLIYANYFFMTVSSEEVFKRLIKLNTGLKEDVSSNADREMYLYRSEGKTVGDCMREMLDLYEISGTDSGYQRVMGHYYSGGVHYCKVSKRKNISDTHDVLYSHPEDRSTDSEHYIIGQPKLRRSTLQKYAKVRVVGKSTNNEPVIAVVSDEASSSSYFDKLEGSSEIMDIYDQNINNVNDAFKEAYRLMDAVQRGLWEGEITLSGKHFLWDGEELSSTFMSGDIIKLYWKPLGISDVKFKVKSCTVGRFKTTVYVNNKDPVLYNRITNALGSMKETNSFTSPKNIVSFENVDVFQDAVIDTNTLYMGLYDQDDKLLPGMYKVECTKIESSDHSSNSYNMNVYNAKFKPGNGWMDNTGDYVKYVKLFTAQKGGSPIANGTFTLVDSSLTYPIDLRVHKRIDTTVVVNFRCKAS